MEAFEAFERDLRDALAHLYDPLYHPPESLRAALGCAPQAGFEALQAALVRAVEELRPAPTVPPTARSRRLYDLLVYRYIQNLAQEETAERLGITSRHLRREQPEAVRVLAQRLWERGDAQPPSAAQVPIRPEAPRPEPTPSSMTPPEWLSQVRQELLALQRSAPGALADVGEVIRRAIQLAENITASYGVTLTSAQIGRDLIAAVHPTTLQQILITAIRQLAEQAAADAITLGAARGADHVRIVVSGRTASAGVLPEVPFIREVLALQGGSAEAEYSPDAVSLSLILPAVDRKVLVVDDNVDLVHVFRRYVVGTRYRIMHLASGQDALRTIEAAPPDVVVLDVMLPDVDGWQLLATLHQHPATRAIPVVVCSVVREEGLAMALGAALYLPKPVEREQFLAALEQAFNQGQAGAPRAGASTAAAY